MNREVQGYSSCHYTAFRIIFGSYLLLHFLHLVSSAPDIWSNQGILADSSLNFTYGIFPNVLELFDAPFQVQCFVAFNALLSLGILLGFWRRTCCLLLWYGWACLFHRNNLISNPGIPFVGWLLLANALIPIGEPLSLSKAKESAGAWRMPASLFYGSWMIAALAYTVSGIDKCQSPSWMDGSAIAHLLENPLARDWALREWMLSLSASVLSLLTWSVLALEVVFGILCIWGRTRPWAWFLIMAMHLGILSIVSFADLTFGMMMIHFFTFDPRWFGKSPREGVAKVVLFDGVCGMCDRSVDFFMSIDSRNLLLFSPLQGEFAAKEAKEESADLSTIVFYDDGTLHRRSGAVLRILGQMGGMWSSAYLLLVVPAPVRDCVYGLIARNRYKFFGKREACRMPTKEEREKFLD